jgi:acyl carrier protein
MAHPADQKVSATLSRSEIIAAIQLYAHEIAEREYPPFSEQQVIAELGLDSLSTLEMVGMIERELGIMLPTDELHAIHTVGALTDLVQLKLAKIDPI